MIYDQFINSKRHSIPEMGFKASFIPEMAFDFQKEVIDRGLFRGRNGNFLDTGLGKTLITISIGWNIVKKENKPVLIPTPLAVAFQFIDEAHKICIDDIEYSRDGKFTKKIVICNYERLHYFDPSDFAAILLDESSILKNFDGKIKTQVTHFAKKMKYRFLATATPSPNDFIELGTSSEFLGHMGYMDMLGKFFKTNQNSVDSNNRNIGEKFYLKPHAEDDFFSWVSQWSIMVRKPSDLGYSDEKYILPKLIENTHEVKNQSLIAHDNQILMFTPIAKTISEVRHEQRQTEEQRCIKAVELAAGKTSVYWCNTNNESKLLSTMDSEAVEIIGSQSIEKKEEILRAFSDGQIKRLVTKAKITGMGLNWQHCNHTTYFPDWSYERYYQSIRRFWRFGQVHDVTAERVISDGQKRVIDALKEKSKKADQLYQKLVNAVNNKYNHQLKDFNQETQLPPWI